MISYESDLQYCMSYRVSQSTRYRIEYRSSKNGVLIRFNDVGVVDFNERSFGAFIMDFENTLFGNHNKKDLPIFVKSTFGIYYWVDDPAESKGGDYVLSIMNLKGTEIDMRFGTLPVLTILTGKESSEFLKHMKRAAEEIVRAAC